MPGAMAALSRERLLSRRSRCSLEIIHKGFALSLESAHYYLLRLGPDVLRIRDVSLSGSWLRTLVGRSPVIFRQAKHAFVHGATHIQALMWRRSCLRASQSHTGLRRGSCSAV